MQAVKADDLQNHSIYSSWVRILPGMQKIGGVIRNWYRSGLENRSSLTRWGAGSSPATSAKEYLQQTKGKHKTQNFVNGSNP